MIESLGADEPNVEAIMRLTMFARQKAIEAGREDPESLGQGKPTSCRFQSLLGQEHPHYSADRMHVRGKCPDAGSQDEDSQKEGDMPGRRNARVIPSQDCGQGLCLNYERTRVGR